MGQFAVDTIIHAPIEVVWARLADIGTISEWNPGVQDSYVIEDNDTKKNNTNDPPSKIGLGSFRYCDLGNSNYLNEEVVTYELEKAITFRIVETNLPFLTADIRFTLQRNHNNGTKVTCSPIYKLKYGPIGEFMDTIMVRRQYRKGMKSLLSGLKADIEK